MKRTLKILGAVLVVVLALRGGASAIDGPALVSTVTAMKNIVYGIFTTDADQQTVSSSGAAQAIRISQYGSAVVAGHDADGAAYNERSLPIGGWDGRKKTPLLLDSVGEVLLGPANNSVGGAWQAPSTKRTYCCAFSVAAVSGDVVELRGAGGTVARVIEVYLVKPSVAVTINIAKRSAKDTGGTSSAGSVVAMDSVVRPPAYCTVNLYTAAPAQGATYGNIWPPVSLGTTDYMVVEPGAHSGAPCFIYPFEALAIVGNASATVNGFIYWTEDPL